MATYCFSEINIQKILFIIASLGVILVLFPAVAEADTENEDPSICEFSRKLEKPYNRVKFVQHISAIRRENYDNGEEIHHMYSAIVKVSLNDREEAELDEMSFQCLACHDGVYATGRLIRIKNVNLRSSAGIDRIHGGHPIGMDYAKYAYRGDKLKKVDQLHPDTVLIQGKVGCLSCHNPLKREKRHLVVSMNDSALCFSCHNK